MVMVAVAVAVGPEGGRIALARSLHSLRIRRQKCPNRRRRRCKFDTLRLASVVSNSDFEELLVSLFVSFGQCYTNRVLSPMMIW